jgi:hypothetical protein
MSNLWIAQACRREDEDLSTLLFLPHSLKQQRGEQPFDAI